METTFIEAVNEHNGALFNWGKFMVARFEGHEWKRYSRIIDGMSDKRILGSRGWDARHLLVLDLETGEGALFAHGGLVPSDLRAHRIWVCPIFEPFLAWLYTQDVSNLEALPRLVKLKEAPGRLFGHRREGPHACPTCGGPLAPEASG